MSRDNPAVWVAVLHISDRTAQKITGRHGIEIDHLRQAVVAVAGLEYAWDEHPERGLRTILSTSIGRQPIWVVLYPAGDSDVYWLGSAYPKNGERL